MKPRALSITTVIVGTIASIAISTPAPSATIAYPPSPVHEVADTLHGQVLIDSFRWLEDDSSSAVRSWTAAQNALTRRTLDEFPGRPALVARLTQLHSITITSRARVRGDAARRHDRFVTRPRTSMEDR